MLRLSSCFFSLAVLILLTISAPARAVEVQVSARALERTLKAQLFNAPEGRYYIRGNPHSSCYVYADDPHVSFDNERIVVHVHTRAHIGTPLHGVCLGLALSTNAEVSVLPEAEEKTIGFRDARVEHLSSSRELNFLLVPFLSHKIPSQMKVDAASLIHQLLLRSNSTTGYDVTLDSLELHKLLIEGQSLNLDLDLGTLHVD